MQARSINLPLNIATILSANAEAAEWSILENGDILTAARSWARKGFSAEEVRVWVKAGIFNPQHAADFRDAEIHPSRLAYRVYYRGGLTLAEAVTQEVANVDEIIEMAEAIEPR